MSRYYLVREVTEKDAALALFVVDKSTVDDGKFPIRAFGPGSLASCCEFLRLVSEEGLPDFQAREIAVMGVPA